MRVNAINPRRFGKRNKYPASAVRPLFVRAIRDLLGISPPSYTAPGLTASQLPLCSGDSCAKGEAKEVITDENMEIDRSRFATFQRLSGITSRHHQQSRRRKELYRTTGPGLRP